MATPGKATSSISSDMLGIIRQQFSEDNVSGDKQTVLAEIIGQLQERNKELTSQLSDYQTRSKGSCITSTCAIKSIKTIFIIGLISQICLTIFLAISQQSNTDCAAFRRTTQATIWLGVVNSILAGGGYEARRQQLDQMSAIAESKAAEENARHEQMLVLMAFLQAYREYESTKEPEKLKAVLEAREKISRGTEADHVLPPLQKLASRLILSDPAHPLYDNVAEIYAATIPEGEDGDAIDITSPGGSALKQRRSTINVFGNPLVPRSSSISRGSVSAFRVNTVFTFVIKKNQRELFQAWNANWSGVEKYMASLGITLPCLDVQGVALTRSSISLGAGGIPKMLDPPHSDEENEEKHDKETKEKQAVADSQTQAVGSSVPPPLGSSLLARVVTDAPPVVEKTPSCIDSLAEPRTDTVSGEATFVTISDSPEIVKVTTDKST